VNLSAMRNAFCQAMLELSGDDRLIFLTGDLGFGALEPLRDALGPRFINAGVAEQNMIAVAAGLARAGLRPWTYSIAPFTYARPFEQIRNDVGLHRLPVRLVGNGGGYGYGVMGATHHALEDYGALLALPNLRVYVPAFARDVAPIARTLQNSPDPAYLRLGLSEEPRDFAIAPYAPWRKLLAGDGVTVIAVGPLVGPLLGPLSLVQPPRRPAVWSLAELPIEDVPAEVLADLDRTRHLIVIEEHVAHGSAGQALAAYLLAIGRAPIRFTHRCAARYPSGRYGSQKYHRRESRLDAESMLAELTEGAST
jgi:transketolase